MLSSSEIPWPSLQVWHVSIFGVNCEIVPPSNLRVAGAARGKEASLERLGRASPRCTKIISLNSHRIPVSMNVQAAGFFPKSTFGWEWRIEFKSADGPHI